MATTFRILSSAMLGIVLIASVATSDACAQGFDTEVLISDLDKPQGINVDLRGNLFYTEVPSPGVAGEESGNRVLRYDPLNEETVVIGAGEPEPLDVTADLFGRSVYWTCRTAGVIIRATPTVESDDEEEEVEEEGV